jgi:hypothetical protein
MEGLSWNELWTVFVDFLANQYLLGKTDIEIARAVTGRAVRWSGTVARMNLGSKYVPGVELSMGSYRVELRDGRHIGQEYLYLHVSDTTSWLRTNVGDHVQFVGQIKKSHERSPFLPVGLIIDEEQNWIAITLAIRDCVRTS